MTIHHAPADHPSPVATGARDLPCCAADPPDPGKPCESISQYYNGNVNHSVYRSVQSIAVKSSLGHKAHAGTCLFEPDSLAIQLPEVFPSPITPPINILSLPYTPTAAT